MKPLPKTSPFGKIKAKYVIIDIMTYLKYTPALQFLWNVNRQGRNFLLKEIKEIDNIYANQGLRVYTFSIT